MSGKINKYGVKNKLINVRAELSRLDDDIKEMKDQEEKLEEILSDAPNGIPEEIQKLKDQRKMLQERIDLIIPKLEKLCQQRKSQVLRQQLFECLRKNRLYFQRKPTRVLQTALPLVVERMKQVNWLFERMYRYLVYTRDDLGVIIITDAGVCDINLILDLPVEEDLIKIIPWNHPSALLRLKKPLEKLDIDEYEKSRLEYFIDDDGVTVIPQQILRWFQRIVDRAKLTDLVIEGVKKISITSSKSARTLQIELDDPQKTFISFNLVPVLRFHYSDWPSSVEYTIFDKTLYTDRVMYLVPKIDKRNPHEPAQKDVPIVWMMQFFHVEEKILRFPTDATPVIKLLKVLRDSQKWHNLHSYYLKTLVLNYVSDYPEKDWSPPFLHERLLEMLVQLKISLKEKSLQHFFFRTVNLFQYMELDEMEKMSEKLDEIMQIEHNPFLVQKYFKI